MNVVSDPPRVLNLDLARQHVAGGGARRGGEAGRFVLQLGRVQGLGARVDPLRREEEA
jgi:hypothetical protein